MLQRLSLVLVLALALLDPRRGAAQGAAIISGTVTDSVTGRPIGGVSITARDSKNSVVARLTASNVGVFVFTAPAPGTYSLELRKLGYRPMQSGAITMERGAPLVLPIRMIAAANQLDTVTTRAQMENFGLTPGRVLYTRHILEGKGQFVSGIEILRSKLSVGDYLGTLPGIRIAVVPVGVVTTLHGFKEVVPSVPGIPIALSRTLTSNTESHCLIGRVDRFFITDLLLLRGITTIDDLMKIENIRAVEVYTVQRDLPPEWRMWVHSSSSVSLGEPAMMLLGHISFGLLGALPIDPQTDRLENFPGHPRIAGAPSSMSLGACGFIQIWTDIAW